MGAVLIGGMVAGHHERAEEVVGADTHGFTVGTVGSMSAIKSGQMFVDHLA